MSHYHFSIPTSYGVKASLQNFTLYLDVDSRNHIKGLFFQGPVNSPWVPLFSRFCKAHENRELLSVLAKGPQGSYPGLMHLPLVLLRNAARRFLNVPSPRYKLLKFKREDLICRCFGVYRPQILKVLSDTLDLTVITAQTRAAAGCMNCRKDIESMIQEFEETSNVRPTEISSSTQKAVAMFIKHSFPDTHLYKVVPKNHTLCLHLKEDNPQILLQTKRFVESNFKHPISLKISLENESADVFYPSSIDPK